MMDRSVTLTTLVTAITAAVLAVAMLAYAVIQHFTMPEMTIGHLLVEHTWHVIVLGALTYAALHILLHRCLVVPVQQLYLTLYKITRGEEETVCVNTRIRELRDIVESVNLVLSTHELPSDVSQDDTLRRRTEHTTEVLRSTAVQLSDHAAHAPRELLIDIAKRLEALASALEGPDANDSPFEQEII